MPLDARRSYPVSKLPPAVQENVNKNLFSVHYVAGSLCMFFLLEDGTILCYSFFLLLWLDLFTGDYFLFLCILSFVLLSRFYFICISRENKA
jgi:hypothetical protein